MTKKDEKKPHDPATQKVIDSGLEVVKIHNDICAGKKVSDEDIAKWHKFIEGMYGI